MRHFFEANIHSLEHSLEDPDVHVPLFEGITGQRIAEREIWEARDRGAGPTEETDLHETEDWKGWSGGVGLHPALELLSTGTG